MNNRIINIVKCFFIIIVVSFLSCLSFEFGELTPLHEAVRDDDMEIFEKQLEMQADVNAQDEKGLTPLHYACANGDIKYVRILLANDADPNLEDNRGETPLHYAAVNCYAEIAALLLECGVDTSIKNIGGDRAVDLAKDIGCNDVVELFP